MIFNGVEIATLMAINTLINMAMAMANYSTTTVMATVMER